MLVPAALLFTTLGLFLATGLLYLTQSKQRELLAVSVRTSGWSAYQAQLEHVKASAALEIAITDPTAQALDDLALRLELLSSRLPILYLSEEAASLRSVAVIESQIRGYELTIGGYLEQLSDLTPGADATVSVLRRWERELGPLGKELQRILQASVIFNEEILRRERELATSPATVPLALMFASGSGLVLVLLLQRMRDRQRLAEVLAARAAAAEMETNLRAVIEAVPAIIVTIDPRDRSIGFINPMAADFVDPSPLHPEWQRLLEAVEEAGNSPADGWQPVNIAFSRPGGEIRSLQGIRSNILWEGRPQMLLALTDVTQNRHAELQVLQSAKLASLGEMATAIAHEANQPLAVIKMAAANAQRLLQQDQSREAVAAKLTRISEQVDRIRRITDQVRRYGRFPSHHKAPFPLRNAMELAIGFVAEQYRVAGIRLDISLDLPSDLAVTGEQTMLEQVIVNLLVNARDASEAAPEGAREPTVAVHAHSDGKEAVIRIEDNAGGIRPDMLERLFEPFATTKSAEKGTGLGLSISRNVVSEMNGSITAANSRDGASFVIVLPVAAEAGLGSEAA